MTSKPRVICAVGAELGEGPIWWEQRLWFTDIKGRKIYAFEPASGALRTWASPDQPGWILPAAGGRFLTGLKSGIHIFDPRTGQFLFANDPEPDCPDNRLNDAAVHQDGTLWFGTMDDHETSRSGRLYRWHDGKAHDSFLAPICITNGPAFSPDGRILYHTDTLGRTIWRVPLRDDGTLGNPTPFVHVEAGAGFPDGPVVDAEGYLWTGLFGGWSVRRYAPNGNLVQTIRFPVANVTKITFGGKRLDVAYATTAWKGLDASQRYNQPLAGHVFAFDPGVTGLPIVPPRFAFDATRLK